jgi:hypothetical protein
LIKPCQAWIEEHPPQIGYDAAKTYPVLADPNRGSAVPDVTASPAGIMHERGQISTIAGDPITSAMAG